MVYNIFVFAYRIGNIPHQHYLTGTWWSAWHRFVCVAQHSSEEAIERVNANESNWLDSSWSPAAESGREAVRDAIRI